MTDSLPPGTTQADVDNHGQWVPEKPTTTEIRKAWQLLHDWYEANNVKHSHTHVREGILLDRLEAAKAKIDSLMLEYCPEDMTEKQIADWGDNQVGASEEKELSDALGTKCN